MIEREAVQKTGQLPTEQFTCSTCVHHAYSKEQISNDGKLHSILCPYSSYVLIYKGGILAVNPCLEYLKMKSEVSDD